MSEKSTVSSAEANGIKFNVYNSVVGENNSPLEYNGEVYDGFYVSYNNYDKHLYGDVTTALVLGQMQKFFILTGNHTKQYNKLIQYGFEKCLDYYKENIHLSHKYSDSI